MHKLLSHRLRPNLNLNLNLSLNLCLNLSLIIVTLLCFGACKKKEEVKNQPPRAFSAEPIRSSPNTISVRWTESTDPENSLVTYMIFIGDKKSEMRLAVSGLTENNSVFTDKDYVVDDYGIGPQIPYPNNNREFKFAAPIYDLQENTAWEGKIVAVDQDGFSTETYFWSSTTDDVTPPNLRSFFVPADRIKNTSAIVFWDGETEEKSTLFIYLNDVFIRSVNEEDYQQMIVGLSIPVSYYEFTGLTPNTTYQAKVILKDRNGNFGAAKTATFTTTN